MLEELKKLKYQGGKEGILFFLCDVVGNNKVSIADAGILCSHSVGKRYLTVEDLIAYCKVFEWIELNNDGITLSENIKDTISDKVRLNNQLIDSTVGLLFNSKIINPTMFFYDVLLDCYCFKNELLPLTLSTVRNTLISQGFFEITRKNQKTLFYVASQYDEIIKKYCKETRKQVTIDQLKAKLADDELAGERAEMLVLEYERHRLFSPLSEKVKRISEIDVAAGYDIISFNTNQSTTYDRFIEVKAVSGKGFYWSRNEYEIAKLKGDNYYLYLVSLSTSDQDSLIEIVPNPVESIIEKGDEWVVETQSYHIKHI